MSRCNESDLDWTEYDHGENAFILPAISP